MNYTDLGKWCEMYIHKLIGGMSLLEGVPIDGVKHPNWEDMRYWGPAPSTNGFYYEVKTHVGPPTDDVTWQITKNKWDLYDAIQQFGDDRVALILCNLYRGKLTAYAVPAAPFVYTELRNDNIIFNTNILD